MAKIKSRDPNIEINFLLEKISQKDDIDFYVSYDTEYQFFPYRVEVRFYGVEFVTKKDYVSIITTDLEKILGYLKKMIEGDIEEFDIESTEGDFFVSAEKAEDEGKLFWVSIDMSGMLFGQDFDKAEGTAISFTFLAEKRHLVDFYKTLLDEAKNIIEDLRVKYPEEFDRLLKFYEKLQKESFQEEDEEEYR